jgi:aldehyde dehydrogenase (NAD+)
MTDGTVSQPRRPERPSPGSLSRDHAFVGGEWVASGSSEALAIVDSGTEQELGTVRSASTAVADAAVAAAHRALPGWAAASAESRAVALRQLHAALAERATDLVSAICAEVGTAVRMCRAIQVDSALNLLALTADLLEQEQLETQVANSIVVRRPVGVVAAITPWNYPLFQTMGKVAGALAAGCTLVHKPSELAPSSAYILAEAVERAGLPAGVYNLVPGRGPTVGEHLVTHPLVAKVSFTGSTKAGTRVYELAARSVKRVALELGGKSPSILLPDADPVAAVRSTVNRAFLNSGQTCDAWTRLLVPAKDLESTYELIEATTRRLTLGDQFDEATRLGPLVSRDQVDRVTGYIKGAVGEGARIVIGGEHLPPAHERGFFVHPTVLGDVGRSSAVVQEEVFGPVLVVLGYESESEALALANDTQYGLSAAVWSADEDHALSFGRKIQAGQVVVNGGGFNPRAPFGGFKLSGIGRELGRYGIDEFLETQALQR